MEPRSLALAPNARAVVSTAVCTLLAVAAHRLMSASAVPVAAVAAGAVMVFCFARIAAALGERGLGTIALLVGGSQVGLHLLFQAVEDAGNHAVSVGASASASAQALSGQAGAVSMPGMSDMQIMPGMPGMANTTDMPAMASMHASGASLFGVSGMTIAHILAALVAAWWLRRGEAAVFAVAKRTGAVLGASWRMLARWIAGARPVRPAGPAAAAVGRDVRRPAVARVLLFTVIRRGPPPVLCG